MFLYLTIYMQGVLDYSPLEAGLRFLPLTVLGFIVAPISGALSHRIPIRVLLGTGLAVVGVGLLLMHGVSPDSEWTTLLAGFIAAGIGIGITNPGIGQAAIAVVPVEKSGMGSGINTTFRQVGIATGVAGLGAVFQSRVDSKLDRAAAARARRARRNRRLQRLPRRRGAAAAAGGPRQSRPRRRRRLRQRLQRDHPDRRRSSPSSAPRSASRWSAPRTSCSTPGPTSRPG